MKLAQNQIQQLYTFTRQHYVEYYDLQTELVDHLSNGIEEQWQENATLSFKEALQKEFKKFGVFGFMNVIEQHQKSMNKRYWKILVRFVKEWFKLPKLIITLMIFILFFLLLQIKNASYMLMGGFLLIAVFDLYKQHKKRRINKQKKDKKEKVFLLEAMIGGTRNGFSAITWINLYNLVHLTKIDFSNLHIYWLFLIAAIATLLCIAFYVTAYVIPQKAEELLTETYPEYKLV